MQNRDETPEPISRSEMLAAIDSEIQRIEDDTRRPGWSNWALQGGIATLIWLAVTEYQEGVDIRDVGRYFLFGAMVVDLLIYVWSVISGPKYGAKKPQYRFISENPVLRPALMLFFLIRYVVLILIYKSIPTLQVPLFTIYCGFFALLAALSIPASFHNYPVREPKLKGKLFNAYRVVHCGCLIYLCGSLFLQLPLSSVQALRIGLLFTGASYLLWLVFEDGKQNNIVNKIKDIRRELAFGRTSVSSAEHSVDKVLNGLSASEAIEHKLVTLKERAQELLPAVQKLIGKCREAEELLKSFENREDVHEPRWVDDARRVSLLIDACVNDSATLEQKYSSLFYDIKRATIEFDAPRENITYEEWVKLVAPLKELMDEADKNFKKLFETRTLLPELKKQYTVRLGHDGTLHNSSP